MAALPAEADPEETDHVALRLMLSYVEAECLRIGAVEAARHAALAAALMPDTLPPRQATPAQRPRRARGLRLH